MHVETIVSDMIKDHDEWLFSNKEKGERFSFKNLKKKILAADLSPNVLGGLRIAFNNVNLTEADFSGIGVIDSEDEAISKKYTTSSNVGDETEVRAIGIGFYPSFDFKDVNLAGSDFCFSNLSNTTFTDSDLVGSTFLDSKLCNVSFQNCGLIYVTFRCFSMSDCNFTDIDLSHTSFPCKTISHTNFDQCSFSEDIFLHWVKPVLKDVCFVDCVFKNTVFMNMKLQGCLFDGSKFSYASFVNVDLSTTTGLQDSDKWVMNKCTGLETVVYKNVTNKLLN